MKTLLVLSPHPDFADEVRSGIDQDQFRVIHRAGFEEAEPLLASGVADACILNVELTNVQAAWLLEKIQRKAPKCPLIVYTAARQWEWEEEAYLHGAAHVLSLPVRPRTLSLVLSRLWQGVPQATSLAVTASELPAPVSREPSVASGLALAQSQPLAVLRDFSALLTNSLDAQATLDRFLTLLRDSLSINRAAIFLRSPLIPGVEASGAPSRHLRAAASLGLSQGLLENLELSLDGGIGAHLARLGRIIRRQSPEAQRDPDTQKEFELLGVQVAIPIMDRETILGVAVFDGRITGEPLSNPELEIIFRLLEPLGMAVKNIWLHAQVAGNHELLAGILREVSNACVVVSRDLAILHANKTARKYFASAERQGGELEFSDLPQTLGAKVYQVLKTGSAISNFKFEPEALPGTIYNVNIVPFQRGQGGLPASALLMAEDLTQSQQLQRLEIEAANLRLVRTMADRLTHEIGNAMVPLSTHQQLLADKWKDSEFRASLDTALAEGVKRVSRLINQMRFLARESLVSPDAFPLQPLIEEAFQEARKYQPVKSAQLKYESGSAPVVLKGDRAALKHAFAEVMLNALQANPSDPKIGVRLNSQSNGRGNLQIEVQDNGSGFSPEAAEKAPAPFFTTRNVGLGLGLTVTRKIIETHHGHLEIVSPSEGRSGLVRISLPLEAAQD
jgi:nitrogen-specific signal transduction histidine kinase/DNA-binding NarL/FixJ family response regulator